VTRSLSAGLLVVGLVACGRSADTEKLPVVVKVQAVAPGVPTGGPRYSGSVVPALRIDLAFKHGGYVDELLTIDGRTVQDGDRVQRGAVLARVRQADYAAKVSQARSQLLQAQAGHEQARNGLKAAQAGKDKAQGDFDRASNLFKTASLTKSDYDAARAQLDAAQATLDGTRALVSGGEAQVEGARALLEEAELALQDASLRAPIDGIVVRRLVEIGSLVGPGTPGFVLADAAGLSVMFAVPDLLLPRIPIGTTIEMTTEALGTDSFTGSVLKVSPAADPKSRAFDVEVRVAKPDPRLKLGMVATVRVPSSAMQEATPVVPLTAIVPGTGSDRYAVFVVARKGEQDVAEQRAVQLGSAIGNDIAVTGGVKAGERVIVTGTSLVRTGDAVRVIP
jgi:RND family efflux transporter MFP subunit